MSVQKVVYVAPDGRHFEARSMPSDELGMRRIVVAKMGVRVIEAPHSPNKIPHSWHFPEKAS
jgi:hypothetical protein